MKIIKTLSKSIREYKKDAILTPMLVALEVLMEILIPFLMALIINNGIFREDMSYILKVSLLIVAAALIALLAGVLNAKTAAKASAGFAKNLRYDLFSKIQNFSFSNVDKFSSASLITRLTTDVQRVQRAFQMLTRICFRAPLTFIFSIIMVSTVGGKLVTIFAIAIPVLTLLIITLLKKVFPVFERLFKRYDRINNVVDENLTGIKTVKAYVREDEEVNKFNTVNIALIKDNYKANSIMILASPLLMGVVYICILLISYVGAKLIVQDAMMVGDLMSVFTYTMQILMSLMMIAMAIVMLSISKTAAERIAEVLNTVEDMDLNFMGEKDIEDGSIEFKNVSFKYSDNNELYCLDNISFSIKDGETIGLLGATASGKSTLISLIARLYDTSKGEVLVGGKNVKDYSVKALRDSVSIVLQKNQLFSGTIRSNMLWGDISASDEEITSALNKANANFVFSENDGLDTVVEQNGANFSGGQKQRLCIARALLKNPKVIIFDDSTSAVDTKTDAAIREELKKIKATKIIISQRIQSVKDAERIIILENGSLNAFSFHDDLIENNEIYQDLYNLQLGGVK